MSSEIVGTPITLERKHVGQYLDRSKLLEEDEETRKLGDSYLRIRKMLKAYNTNYGGHNRFEVTEKALRDLIEERDKLIAELESEKNQTRRR